MYKLRMRDTCIQHFLIKLPLKIFLNKELLHGFLHGVILLYFTELRSIQLHSVPTLI